MALVYLALSPGSVPVEQLFSTAGLILNGKRSQLIPFWMNMICFVHDNYKHMWIGHFSCKKHFSMTFNRWRTVVSATWKYDDPRLNMSHEGAARVWHVQPRVVIYQVTRYQKGKTNLDFTEARDSQWQWHQLGHMHCKSAPRSRQITMPAPHRSVFYRLDALPAAQPTVSKLWRHCHLNQCIDNIITHTSGLNNNNDRLTAFDPGQPG